MSKSFDFISHVEQNNMAEVSQLLKVTSFGLIFPVSTRLQALSYLMYMI